MNPPGTFQDGKRLKEIGSKDIPALSAKLLPEFDKRRNIKDMFKRQTSTPTSQDFAGAASFSQASPSQSTQDTNDIPNDNESAKIEQPQPRIINSNPLSPLKPSSSAKRKIQTSPRTNANKRNKPQALVSTPSARQSGQQSLKGFFLPKQIQSTIKQPPSPTADFIDSDIAQAISNSNLGIEKQDARDVNDSSQIAPPSTLQSPRDPSLVPTLADGEGDADLDTAQDSADVFDPIVSKESWSKLFTKPQVPRCEDHDEPCISYETKKKGYNCGRRFWTCPR
jgi:AP endonuclease-2